MVVAVATREQAEVCTVAVCCSVVGEAPEKRDPDEEPGSES